MLFNTIQERLSGQELYEALQTGANQGSGEILEVREDLSALAQDPLPALRRVLEQIATGHVFGRLRVTALTEGAEQSGIDAGGLRRAFLSLLFKALSESPTLGEFTFSKEEHGFLPKLPSLDQEISQETTDMLETIGILLGFCVIDGNCRTQPLFDPSFFVALTTLSAQQIRDQDKQAAYLALNKNDPYFEQVKEAVDEYCNDDPFVPALLIIARGMLNHLEGNNPNAWQKVNDMSANELLEKIEGRFSKELLLEKLTVSDDTVNTHLRKWIDAADTKTLLEFVDAITGTPSLGPGQVWIGLLADDDTAPARFHTCFNKMDIRPYSNYEEFAQKLEWAITNAKGFGDS